MSGLSLVVANAAIRLGYGVAALVAPSKPILGRVPLAPDTEEFPQARLFVRGFASHQIAVAGTDFADIISAVVEVRGRGRLDPDLRDGIVFSSAGLASSLVALREPRFSG
jgi:hypothetical protein